MKRGGLVRSTIPDYLRLLEAPEGEARRAAWVDDYEAAHPAVFATYYESWGNPDGRAAAADAVTSLAPVIPGREARARSLVERAGHDLVDIAVLDRPQIPAVLLVGGHTSNGWVADIEGVSSLFLALEFLGEPPLDDVLVVHEAVHLGHLARSAASWPQTVGEALFSEGLAVALSRRLRPGLDDTAYLWFDDTHEPWVGDCRAREDNIRRTVLDALECTDGELIAQLFSAKPGSPLPIRCGYWLGDLVLRALLDRGVSPVELVNLSYLEALAVVRHELEA
jgi:hypothetical protein